MAMGCPTSLRPETTGATLGTAVHRVSSIPATTARSATSTISTPGAKHFKNVEKTYWQIWFSAGLVLGGVIVFLLVPVYQVDISSETIQTLEGLNVVPQKGLVPLELYSFDLSSILVLLAGGIFIGFGARYANGCTAGHAIMGCAQLSKASIISTVFFFVGGLIATYLILPVLL